MRGRTDVCGVLTPTLQRVLQHAAIGACCMIVAPAAFHHERKIPHRRAKVYTHLAR
jgi:hypothetical protein